MIKNKNIVNILLIGFVFLLIVEMLYCFRRKPLNYCLAKSVNNSNYIVINEATNEVLAGNNQNVRLPIASTTKIATLIVALESGIDLSSYVKISNKAVGIEGSSIYLKDGEYWKFEDLLYGLMLRSGNDAATQIAITVGGSVERFVEIMNDLVDKLDLKNTRFTNPHGLNDNEHYSSAYDLAVLTSYGFKNKFFEKIVGTKTYTTDKIYSYDNERKEVFINKNKLLSSYDGACGVKTGYTKIAGKCLVSAVKQNGIRLICVTLNNSDMWNFTINAFDDAFKKIES